MGISYTQVNINNAKDNAGKVAKYDTISQTELEVSVQLEKYFFPNSGIIKTYIRPGIVQVITTGDKVRITGIDEKILTYNDGTLGRIEIGEKYDLLNQLSTYGFINYSFGSNYRATSINLGLSYTW